MCDTCGCNITHGNEGLIRPGGKLQKTESGREAVTVLHSLLHENDHTAKHNRDHFDQHDVLAINLMSSPGAGKTALLEATIQQLGLKSNSNIKIAVIEGDLETENDADRIRRHGVEGLLVPFDHVFAGRLFLGDLGDRSRPARCFRRELRRLPGRPRRFFE